MADETNIQDESRENAEKRREEVRKGLERQSALSQEYYHKTQQIRERKRLEKEGYKAVEIEGEKEKIHHVEEEKKKQKEWTKKEQEMKKLIAEEKRKEAEYKMHQDEWMKMVREGDKEREKYMKELNELGQLKIMRERHTQEEKMAIVNEDKAAEKEKLEKKADAEDNRRKTIVGIEGGTNEKRQKIHEGMDVKRKIAVKEEDKKKGEAQNQLTAALQKIDEQAKQRVLDAKRLKRSPEEIQWTRVEADNWAKNQKLQVQRVAEQGKEEAERGLRSRLLEINGEEHRRIAELEDEMRKGKAETEIEARQNITMAEKEALRRKQQARKDHRPYRFG